MIKNFFGEFMMKKKIRLLTECALFAALLCICSSLSVTIGAVPFSLAFFGVMLTGVILGPVSAPVSVTVFLLVGMFLPVFSGGRTGVTALPGPTGGYIWSYLPMVLIIALFCKIRTKGYFSSVAVAFAGCCVGGFFSYMCGTLQFSLFTGKTFSDALTVCILPFILPDLIKAVIASFLGVEIRRILLKNGLI